MRICKGILQDEDSYVYSGILLLGSGATALQGVAAGLVVWGSCLLAFGIWMGFWRLSARR